MVEITSDGILRVLEFSKKYTYRINVVVSAPNGLMCRKTIKMHYKDPDVLRLDVRELGFTREKYEFDLNDYLIVLPEDADPDLTWSVNNTTDFSIDGNGILTVLNLGIKSATVTVTVKTQNGRYATQTITVYADEDIPLPTSIALQKVSLGYDEYNFEFDMNEFLTIEPWDAYARLTWSVDNAIDFSINENGILKIKDPINCTAKLSVIVTVKTSNNLSAKAMVYLHRLP